MLGLQLMAATRPAIDGSNKTILIKELSTAKLGE
jgi:hypothetical protein